MPTSAPVAASLFGLGAGAVRAIVDTMLGEITRWVAAGAGSVLGSLGAVLTSTTTPDLGAGFLGEYATMTAISAGLALPLLLLAVVRAVVHQDLAELLRATLLRLPVALLLAGAAVGLVSLALQAADALSGALLAVAGHPVGAFVGNLVIDLTVASAASGSAADGGFAALLLAAVAAVVAFLLWVELVVRSAAVAAATLFVPLALAGLVWPATAHWARRLAETLFALVLAKVVVAGVLALAGTMLASGAGISGAIEGVALLLLATFAPFTVLRLVPMVEGGAISHLEGSAGRSVARAARTASLTSVIGSAAGDVVGHAAGSARSALSGTGGPGGGASGAPPTVLDDVPVMEGVDLASPEVREEAARSDRSAHAARGDRGGLA
ncbi:MAG TPA: hypothetical protein VMV02_06790 [Acidimicrobiales bacterium]|nr:hypothetical protein [Acidimicrobiales bacterium]